MALTDTAIRGAKPGTKPFKLYDREEHGCWHRSDGRAQGRG
jgi:hypothetical protein